MALNESGFIGALAGIYVLQLFLYGLGKFYRLGNNPHDSSQHDTTDKFTSRRVFTTFSDVLRFPKFYMVFYLLLPGVIMGIANAALSDGAEDLFFINSLAQGDQLTKTSQTGQMLVWGGVYFFAASAVTWTLASLQSAVNHAGMDKVFKMLPLQYYKRINTQLKFFGSILFTIGTLILTSEISPDDTEDEGLDKLLSVTLLAPFLLMLDVNYVGFCNLMDGFYLASLPGIKVSWFLMEFVIGGLITLNIHDQNSTAGLLILSSYVLLAGVPMAIWSTGCRFVTLPGGDHKRESITTGIEMPDELSPRELVTADITIQRKLKLGQKHWIFSPFRFWWMPISVFVTEEPRETSNDSKLLFVSDHLEPTFFLSSIKGLSLFLKPFFAPLVLPFVVLALLWHYILLLIGSFQTTLVFGDKAKDIGSLVITPGMGRSIYPAHGKFEKFIYLVDGPGIPAALAYIRDAFFVAREGKGSYHFVFECQTGYDYVLLSKRLLNELEEHREFPKWSEHLDFTILLNGSCVGVNKLFGGMAKKDDGFKDDITSKTIFHPNAKALRTFLPDLVQETPPESVSLLAIGSSDLCLGAYRLKNKFGCKKMTISDLVVEDSMFRMPTQTEAYER